MASEFLDASSGFWCTASVTNIKNIQTLWHHHYHLLVPCTIYQYHPYIILSWMSKQNKMHLIGIHHFTIISCHQQTCRFLSSLESVSQDEGHKCSNQFKRNTITHHTNKTKHNNTTWRNDRRFRLCFWHWLQLQPQPTPFVLCLRPSPEAADNQHNSKWTWEFSNPLLLPSGPRCNIAFFSTPARR